ncbi:MAG: alpha/beta hydrolase [Alphaproteobacteria bacterium]|nr:alpha/beta hydrolase [Alphaproteobacteria bacterium]
MKIYQSQNAQMHYTVSGVETAQPVIWAHGWGQTHQGLEALKTPFEQIGHHYALDFCGFGQSPEPLTPWGTEDYADFVAEFIKNEIKKPVLWIGHSFGCRVGIQIAARHPELITGLCLIAGAGLPRKRPLLKKLYFKTRILTYKLLKKLSLINLINKDWLARKFGSADYKNTSGTMRQVFVKVVNEDLSPQAQSIQCFTQLIYGQNDTETPPEIGERLKSLIPRSEMVHLASQDHYSVLADGRHQVTPILKKFIEGHSETS